EKLIEACGLSRVSGHVSCVGQKLPSSGRASTIATSRPAFWRYVAAGSPPEMPPPTTITSCVSMVVSLIDLVLNEGARWRARVQENLCEHGADTGLRRPPRAAQGERIRTAMLLPGRARARAMCTTSPRPTPASPSDPYCASRFSTTTQDPDRLRRALHSLGSRHRLAGTCPHAG